MNEKVKTSLKIFGIWYIVVFIVSMICIYFSHRQFGIYDIASEILIGILVPIIIPIVVSIIFFPALIALYFLFKKYKSIKARIFLVSFIFPFINAIYYIIERYIGDGSFALTSMIIGWYSLFVVLPLLFISILCMPKSLLPFKKEAIYTSIIMWIMGWFLILFSNIFIVICDNFIDKIELKKYDKVINQIEDYKIQNGVYPSEIENNFENLHYFRENGGNDYIISVYKSDAQYNYCSAEKIKGCAEGYYDYSSHKKSGKWIKVQDAD